MFPYLLPYSPCSPLPIPSLSPSSLPFHFPMPSLSPSSFYADPFTLSIPSFSRLFHLLHAPNPLPILSPCHSLHLLNNSLHPLLPGLFILYMSSSHALHLSHTIPILSQYHPFPIPIPSPSHTLQYLTPSPSPPHAIHPSHALPFTLPILYLLPTLYLHLSLSLNAL